MKHLWKRGIGAKMNRRDFLKGIAALVAIGLVSTGRDTLGCATIEIVECEIDESILTKSTAMDKLEVIDGQAVACFSFDTHMARTAVSLIDTNGKRYTLDEIERLVGS